MSLIMGPISVSGGSVWSKALLAKVILFFLKFCNVYVSSLGGWGFIELLIENELL